MAKADLVLSNGTTVAIEGTADEVAILLSKFSQPSEGNPAKKKAQKKGIFLLKNHQVVRRRKKMVLLH